MTRNHLLLSLIVLATVSMLDRSATAADGRTTITQAKALAGKVTPGDKPGFPVTLSTPGSYILGDNLSPGAGLDAIVVEAPDVTIDLNGFRVSGGPAGGANNARIGINAKSDRLRVKNGTIGAFKLYGIYSYNHSYLIVENMMVINGRHGIYNYGSFARIQNNTVATNTGYGIFCERACHVEGNVVSNNGYGVVTNSGTVLGNTILDNQNFGIYASSGDGVAFGNNTLIGNNGGGAQTDGQLDSLHPNVCLPAC